MGIRKESNGAYSWSAKGAPPTPGGPPGWYDDPEAPGLQRYWTGQGWHAEMPPRATPEPAWKQARIIALGILIAAAAILVFVRLQGPSDEECAQQFREVLAGQRLSLEDGCR